MTKRASLATALDAATAAKGAKPGKAPAASSKGTLGAQSGRDKTTAITISGPHWDLLRAVAAKRAATDGGRNSVSAVIADLIEGASAKLAAEAGPFLKLYQGKA